MASAEEEITKTLEKTNDVLEVWTTIAAACGGFTYIALAGDVTFVRDDIYVFEGHPFAYTRMDFYLLMSALAVVFAVASLLCSSLLRTYMHYTGKPSVPRLILRNDRLLVLWQPFLHGDGCIDSFLRKDDGSRGCQHHEQDCLVHLRHMLPFHPYRRGLAHL